MIGWTEIWEKNISMISETTVRYPQESYAAITRAIQSEWIFLQWVMKDAGFAFTVAEILIRKTFLPHLFFMNKNLLPHHRNLKYNSGQEIWPGYPKTGDTSSPKTESLQHASVGLVNEVIGKSNFSTSEYYRSVREEHREVK